MIWTEEKIAELKRLDAIGLSRSQIAAQLGEGLSRNAVIGKLLRLKEKTGYIPTQRKIRPRKIELRVPSTTRLMKVKFDCEELPEEKIDVKREDGVTLLDLKMNNCRWPYGVENFYFCGRDRIEHSPYCLSHAKMSYRK